MVGCGNDDRQDSSPAPTTTSLTSAAPAVSTTDAALRLVAIGDSVPYNSPEDCPGCTGFVDRYAEALGAATGRPVEIENLSMHNGLTLPMLIDGLAQTEETLAAADAIIVGIAHNSILLAADDPCGTTWDPAANSYVDWTLIDRKCSDAWVAEYRPLYDELFSTIVEWRAGRPTILLALNKYSDWIGWTAGNLTRQLERTTTMVHDAWNEMICASAEEHGFECVDVYHAFNGSAGDRAAGDLLAPDYIHPSDLGNEVIAQLLTDVGFVPLV